MTAPLGEHLREAAVLGCGSRRFGSPKEQDHRNLVS
jgi:hypothetical protein